MRNAAPLAALGLAMLLGANPGAASPGGGPQVQWVHGYGGAETEEHPHAAIQVSDGGYVIVGETVGHAGSRIFVVRTDEHGRLRFARSYGAGRFNLGNFVLQEADGRFLVAGSWDAGTGAVQEDRVAAAAHRRRRGGGAAHLPGGADGTPSRASR